MKSWRLAAICALILTFFASTASAAGPVDWKGITWDEPYEVIELQSGNLKVTSSTCLATSCWGAAHYNTPAEVRNAPAHSVSFTFIDPGPGASGVQIWIEKEGSPNAAWTQFGAWDGDTNYRIYWWNVDTGIDGTLDTNVARTAGYHTLKVGKRADGTVDYYVDNGLVASLSTMNMGYIGDVYLAAHSTPPASAMAMFVDYTVDTDYPGPTPRTKLCIHPASGNVRMPANCRAYEWTRWLPDHAPLTLCAHNYSGNTRYSLSGSCNWYERTVIALGDQTLPACVGIFSGELRLPFMAGTCQPLETEKLI